MMVAAVVVAVVGAALLLQLRGCHGMKHASRSTAARQSRASPPMRGNEAPPFSLVVASVLLLLSRRDAHEEDDSTPTMHIMYGQDYSGRTTSITCPL